MGWMDWIIWMSWLSFVLCVLAPAARQRGVPADGGRARYYPSFLELAAYLILLIAQGFEASGVHRLGSECYSPTACSSDLRGHARVLPRCT